MPLNPVWIPQSEILTYEEMARVVRILARMGVFEDKAKRRRAVDEA
jgi:hypothetical protein